MRSGKFKGFDQPYLEARLATLESTMIEVEISNLTKFLNSNFFLQIIDKITKIVISLKLKRFCCY